uniref:RNA-binding protein 7 n=1 Tax=Lygus hesperus TaxID=30085 RepID=A0A0A9WUU6_LYGHE
MSENTVYVDNLSEKVTEDLLYELFSQAGPVEKVNISNPFGFVRFKHQCSVPYAVNLMEGIRLFGRTLKICGPWMGLSRNTMVQKAFIHPSSQLSSSLEPRDSRTGRQNIGEGDLRNKLKPRFRPKDRIMPSSRWKKVKTSIAKRRMEAIRDFLGSGSALSTPQGDSLPHTGLDGRDERDLRNKLKPQSQPEDLMMPSSHQNNMETPLPKEMEAIPDFLGSGFNSLYSSGQFVAPYQLGCSLPDGRDERDRGRDN